MTSTASSLSAGEILKQDSLGRVRTPLAKLWFRISNTRRSRCRGIKVIGKTLAERIKCANNKNIVADSIIRFIVHSIINEDPRQIGQSLGDRSQGCERAGRAWPGFARWS
jgi:hypothetical protein